LGRQAQRIIQGKIIISYLAKIINRLVGFVKYITNKILNIVLLNVLTKIYYNY